MRILFFGTPGVAVPFLEEAVRSQTVVGVVAQPDRPAERGYQLKAPAAKVKAQELGIPVFQPEKFTPEIVRELAALRPDAGVVVSYGKIIPPDVFMLPPCRCFNVHFSLLPRYRGAAPVQWAIINGEKETGVTTFYIEKGLDTGPIILQKALPVDESDDSVSLMDKLIALGVPVMTETLGRIAEGAGGTPQSGEASYAPVLSRDDGRIDWSRDVRAIFNRIRGTRPWPGAFTTVGSGKAAGSRLKILRAAIHAPAGAGAPGEITGMVKNRGFVVQCGSGSLIIEEVHPENRKPMPAWSYLQGGTVKTGDSLK